MKNKYAFIAVVTFIITSHTVRNYNVQLLNTFSIITKHLPMNILSASALTIIYQKCCD